MIKTTKERIFAKDWGYSRIFLIFVIGCLIGTLYEQCTNYISNGVWQSRSALLYGPFNPTYGIGVALFILVLGKNNDKRKWYMTFFFTFLLGGIAEYFASFFEECFFNASSWDYTGYFLNINGRTTIPYMIGWGFAGLIFMKFVYPYLCKLLMKIPYKIGNLIVICFTIFMAANIILTFTALYRKDQRLKGKNPKTFIGEFCDKNYSNEYLEKKYPNMIYHD